MAVGDGLDECRAIEATETIHFVTHSLGGILVRQYLSENEIPELGRVVMLGPPNQGSAAVDELGDVPGFDWINGPAGQQLGQGEDSVPLQLGPADFEVGIIAGNRTIDPVTSAVLANPDDGRVSVEDTKLKGMTDFVIVDHSHAFMMRMTQPIELTIQISQRWQLRQRGVARSTRATADARPITLEFGIVGVAPAFARVCACKAHQAHSFCTVTLHRRKSGLQLENVRVVWACNGCALDIGLRILDVAALQPGQTKFFVWL